MTGGVRKKTGFSIHLLVVLLFFVCAVVVALLVRGNGCCVVVQVALLPRLIPVGSSWDASPTAATTPSGKITIPATASTSPATASTRGASSPDDERQEASEAVAASEEDEPPAAAPYAADSRWNIQWESVASVLSSFSRNGVSRVGLLNFNSSEVARWTRTLHAADVLAVRLAPAADDVTWEALYPDWIDEKSNRSSCPSLPDPDAAPHHSYDLVVVKLPCRAKGWSRDVRRLHLQLTAAKLALHGNGSSSKAGMVLILSESGSLPLPNLFPCKHLLARRGHAFLYRPEATYLRHRLSLPVGSCQLAVPFVRPSPTLPTPSATPSRISRQAYATVLHSADAYVCGAIALARSIRDSGSTRDLVALVDAHNVGAEHRAALAAAGWHVRLVPRIRNPHAKAHAYNEWNYSKFRLWQLTDYDKVVFLDADLLVLRNMDFLFEEAPELSATVNSGLRFNSGVMVLEPCNCTFDMLMSGIHNIESYNGGDQGYLNEVFTWWHRLPRQVNFLKFVWAEGDRAAQARMLAAEPADVHAVHYLGIKPWMCYRDYDCNWNAAELRRFASDEAHARWWAVHDRIEPVELREKFCALSASHVEVLEHQRREAETVNAPDGRWNRTITDPRRHVKVQNPTGQAKNWSPNQISRNALRTAWAWLRKIKS